MRLLLLLLVITLPAAASAPWDSCPANSYPLVRNPAANESALQAQLPSGDYYPSEMVSIVDAYARGETCGPVGSQWTTATGVENDNGNFTASKDCKIGPTTFRTVYASGNRVCSHLDCPLKVGKSYPWGSASQTVPSGDGTFCYQGCQLQLRGIGLTIGGGGGTTVRDIYVASNQCSAPYESFLHSEHEQCTTINGQDVCTSPGAAATPSATINSEPYAQSVGDHYAVCNQHSCPERDHPVATAGDGSQVAPVNTPTPPAPDTGTAGQPAPPDLSISVTDENGQSHDYSYWSPSTVHGSTTYVPGDGGGDGGDDGGDGDGGGGINGGQNCGDPPQCTEGSDPIQCFNAQKLYAAACALTPASPDALQAEAARFTDPTPEDGTILPVVKKDISDLVIPYNADGACPSDLPVVLPAPFNTTVTIPLSRACELLKIVGAFLHLAAALAALRIVVI